MNEQRKEAIRRGVIEKLKREGRYTGEFVKTAKNCVKCGSSFKPKRASQSHCSFSCYVIHDTPEKLKAVRSKRVSHRRRQLKAMAVELLGGCCDRCGYSKSIAALEFHHKDPNLKDFTISSSGSTKSWERVKAEALKCLLVCSNCHREIHDELRE